jgi:hypothetical protein
VSSTVACTFIATSDRWVLGLQVSRRRLARSTPSRFQANITDLAIIDDPVKLEADAGWSRAVPFA